MLPTRDMLASDAEREAVGRALQRHCADGRLEPDELEERLDAAYRARWRSELRALTRDLPRVVERPEAVVAVRHRSVAWLRWGTIGVVVLAALGLALHAMSPVMAGLFVAFTVPMLVISVIVLTPFALAAAAATWLARALSRRF